MLSEVNQMCLLAVITESSLNSSTCLDSRVPDGFRRHLKRKVDIYRVIITYMINMCLAVSVHLHFYCTQKQTPGLPAVN